MYSIIILASYLLLSTLYAIGNDKILPFDEYFKHTCEYN
jgi:hypothetical protein